MDFTPSPRVQELKGRIIDFMNRHVYPNEQTLGHVSEMIRPGLAYPPTMVELRKKAKALNTFDLSTQVNFICALRRRARLNA